jgi:hypothetical protein
MPEIDQIMDFTIQYHAEDEIFLIFAYVISQQPLSQPGMLLLFIYK